jgi:hypothetical protein
MMVSVLTVRPHRSARRGGNGDTGSGSELGGPRVESPAGPKRLPGALLLFSLFFSFFFFVFFCSFRKVFLN